MGDSVEMVHITARQYQMCPISRHTKGNTASNTRAASSDQDDFVVQDTVCKDAHQITRLVKQDLLKREKTGKCIGYMSRVGK
jgi:hypothetical protein